MIRTLLMIILLVLVVGVVLYAFGVIDVQQTRQARLPEVQTQGGQMPAFDVETPDVDVGTRNETVKVPEISIDRPREPEETEQR
ncbi:hypothetical protein [Rhizorhapis suberifaciens]|uniref:Uncharacterized protein n=1 Tax=Rhizorhapis suberifaciens TaxID=13656 RepID=A0A840HW68_9SPHN|nr:hypothetical protein [Rhizorhapis suberifaciens]MBB4641778.1 hypothetical protein [Rhizorhapis suberifaciens]